MFAAIVNMLAIIACSILGLLFKKVLPEKAQDTLMQGMGLMIIIIGAKMAVGAENDVVIVLALAVGGLIGEALKLDMHMENLGVRVKKLCHVNDSNFVEAFVSASLIFCATSRRRFTFRSCSSSSYCFSPAYVKMCFFSAMMLISFLFTNLLRSCRTLYPF